MNTYVIIVLVMSLCTMLTSAQFGHFGFSNGYFGTSFGAPGYQSISGVGARDPRANTGPVVFPPSPPGDPSQTSGVVVGASGYGFQPPGGQVPAVPRYYYRGFFTRR